MRYKRFLLPTSRSVSPATARKWNPGHYVAIQKFQQESARGTDSGAFTMANGITGNYSQAAIPGGHTGNLNGRSRYVDGPASTNVTGLIQIYYWNQFEDTQDVYDFTQMDGDLATCEALGVQLIMLWTGKTFNLTNDARPTYLASTPYSTRWDAPTGNQGYIISRWNSFCQERFRAAMEQISARYDDHPNFEGIATQETSSNMTAAQESATNYSGADFLAGLKYEVDTLNSVFTTSRHFGFHNYMNDTSAAAGDAKCLEYALYMANTDNGSCCGGPDILPKQAALQNRVYPHYDAIYAQAYPHNGPTFCSAQNDTYDNSNCTMQQIYDFSTGNLTFSGRTLHLDYIFWNLNENGGAADFNPDARDVIANPANQNFQHWTPPA